LALSLDATGDCRCGLRLFVRCQSILHRPPGTAAQNSRFGGVAHTLDPNERNLCSPSFFAPIYLRATNQPMNPPTITPNVNVAAIVSTGWRFPRQGTEARSSGASACAASKFSSSAKSYAYARHTLSPCFPLSASAPRRRKFNMTSHIASNGFLHQHVSCERSRHIDVHRWW
jgi:hypothetical protein